MKFVAAAETDVGITKNINQDSVLMKHAACKNGEILLAVICDGMGGLDKGELASATVIKAFSDWFEKELPYELEQPDMNVIGGKQYFLLKDLNADLIAFGRKRNIRLGTTFTSLLLFDKKYVIAHVGDTRAYYIGASLRQLTADQTFVAREISKGTMTVAQAKTDKRRNALLQCIGASDKVEPEILMGDCQKGAYLLCSDGFRHKISEEEIYQTLKSVNLVNQEAMHQYLKYLIELDKTRQEPDNISAVLIKTD